MFRRILIKIVKNKLLFIAGVAVAAYFAYGAFKGKNAPAPQYATVKVQRGTLVVSVSGSGQMAASDQTNIQAQGSGNVVAIPVTDNQKVVKGDLLVKLDTTNDERSARNARLSLQSAELQMETLLQPPATSTLLQSENAVAQAKQSLDTANNNLATDYNNAYTAISNAFIDIPGVMTGLNNVLYGTYVNRIQGDIDAYTNMISNTYPAVVTYNQSAASGYAAALAAYNQNLADYKNSSVYSGTSTVESLLSETYGTLQKISVANGAAKNLLDVVYNTLQQNSRMIPSQLTFDETSMQSYITTTNSHLSGILQESNSLQSDKQSITAAGLSLAQTTAALEQLRNGPTDLEIQAQRIAVTQAQNSLTDAEANLQNDYVRAPFSGIVTNISAKLGQPAAGTLAVLLGNQQLAQATLNETDVVNVKVGQKATVTFDALPNLTLTGKLAEVDSLGTVSQGVVSYNVQVALDDNNPSVKAGMSDTVEIITNAKQNALLLPNSAITVRGGSSYVMVIGTDGLPKETEVTTGLSNDTETEILSGVSEGDAVVTQAVATNSAQNYPRGGNVGFGGGGGLFRVLGH